MTEQKKAAITPSLPGLSRLENVIIEAIQDKKGLNIIDLNLESLESAPAHSFIVCQGKSTSQVSSIADNIRDEVKKQLNLKPYNYDGYRNSQWIILDYGEVMVHVFLPEFREYYNIEDLWSDSKITVIPDLD